MKPGKALREIFLKAAEMDACEARAAYLEQTCAGDTRLRRQIQALLDAEAEVGEAHETVESREPWLDPLLGSRIGPYKLLQQIGEGGCGVVYMAEQEKPVRRRVALKVIKLGMDTKQVVARFEAERQALAVMDHPNVAQVLDGGATDSGRPFFVMELVRGVRITQYCDEHRLSTHQRLDLFIDVCRAVQHAHQKGIIHRDIKPSNILVTELDGKPLPKIIDFGIAKAIEGRLTDQTLFTAFEQFLGTPAYMSPEQATLTAADVDTRGDIYSLGVLLYELLTGETPFDTRSLIESGLDEIRRTIRETEPLRPSTRLNSLEPRKLTSIAKSRESEPPKLIHLVRGDLDWIVMKCLEKDRNRRYETANGLAMDIRRHLSNEPIVARPPSFLYALHRSFRRNRLAISAAAAVALALLAGMGATLWQYWAKDQALERAVEAEQVAREERGRAERAGEQATRERDQAELLAAEAALERGQSKLEAGDSWGLLDLVEAYRLAEHHPALQETVGRRWSIWHAEWDRRTVAIRGTSGVLTPDYLQFASQSESRVVNLHDTLTGIPLGGGLPHESDVQSRVFSPDGRLLATLTDRGMIHVWDCQTGVAARPPTQTGAPHLNHLLFSPDGRSLLAFEHGVGRRVSSSVAFLGLSDSRTEPRLLEHRYRFDFARFSPDGQVLAIMAAPDLQLWRTDDLQRLGSPIGVGYGRLLQFNRDGTRLAIEPAGSRDVGLLDLQTRRITGHFPTSDGPTLGAFSHDGNTLATVDWDLNLELWRTDTASAPAPYVKRHFLERIHGDLSFNPDDSLLAFGHAGGTVRVVRTSDGQSLFSFPMRPGVESRFLTNGILFATGWGKTAFWDLMVSPMRGRTLPHDGLASSLAFDPSGGRLAVGGEDELRLWSMPEPPRLERIISMPGRVLSVTFSEADDRFVAFIEDGSLISIEPHTGTMRLIKEIERGYDLSACLSPDARQLALFNYYEAVLVDTRTGVLQQIEPEGGFRSVTFRDDSERLAIGAANWDVCLYDVSADGATLSSRAKDIGGWVEGVAYHPSGRLLAANVEGQALRLCDPKDGRQLSDYYEPSLSRVDVLRFSPDGSLLATAGQTRDDGYGIELWHVNPQLELERGGSILACDHPIWSLAFSPDGRTLAVGGLGSTRLWYLPAGPADLEDVRSRTWYTLAVRMDDDGKPVHQQQKIDEVEEVRARITRDAPDTDSSLDEALGLPPEEALESLQALVDQHRRSSVYRALLGKLHADLMVTNAVSGQWSTALVHANEALRLGHDDPHAWARSALLSVAAKDIAGFQASCRAMVTHYASTEDPAVVRWIALAVTLRPGALEDYAEFVNQVASVVPRVGGVHGPAYRFFLGAVLARAGRYAEAATELEQVERHMGAKGVHWDLFSPAHNRFLLAICHAHLGNPEKGRQWFSDATADAQSFLQTNPGAVVESWESGLILELLQEEAEATLVTHLEVPQ
jgi:serine/threonine protein kinase/WD40 repeat protein